MLVVSLALVFTVGCHRDPNVRKQKYLESGKRYEENGKYKEAAIQFSNAMKVDQNFADAHFELAKTYLKMRSVTPAYFELMKTVDLDPNNIKAHITFGNLLLAGHATGAGCGPGQCGAGDQPKQCGCIRSACGGRAGQGR